MIERRRVDAEGRIVASFSGSQRQWDALTAAALDGWDGPNVFAATAEIAAETHYWDGQDWALRVTPPDLPEFVAGVPETVNGTPEGATVEITDPATGVVAASDVIDATASLTLTLPAGAWRVSIGGTATTLPRIYEIEVSA